MNNKSDTFFTLIGCMDGRVHKAVVKFGKERFNAKYGDTITEAGLVEYIQVNPYDDFMENFKNKVNLSVIKHKSRGIVVFGHQDCLGNPVEDNVHKNDVLRSAGFIKSLVSDIDVIPVFVVQKEKSWEVEEL